MTAALHLGTISVDDYLVGERIARRKHEYVSGVVYAMAGATNAHNLVASNILVSLGRQLHSKKCRAFNSDTKIRIRQPFQTRFYYPDASVVCRLNPPDDTFQDEPVVIVEVMSKSTRRIDDGEKREAYLTINSLAVLVLVEQDSPAVVVHRRKAEGFVRETYQGLESTIPLSEVGISLPLAEIYESVVFVEESDEDAEA